MMDLIAHIVKTHWHVVGGDFKNLSNMICKKQKMMLLTINLPRGGNSFLEPKYFFANFSSL